MSPMDPMHYHTCMTFGIQEEIASKGYRAPVICTPEELLGG